MDGAGTFGRKPRPVADAPAVDAVAIAKAWLLALVADAPLQQVGAVPAAELARGGPALCGAILAALGSDAELERLVGGDGRGPLAASAARLTGARTPAAVAAGVEALRSATWRTLRAELRDPAPELVADLSDRLAYVCARVAATSLTGPVADVPRGGGPLAEMLAAVPAQPSPSDRDRSQAAHDAAARALAGLAPRSAASADAAARALAGLAPRSAASADAAARALAGLAPKFAPDEAAAQVAVAAAIDRAAREAAAQREAEAAGPAEPPHGVELVDLPPALPSSPDPLSSLAEELAAAPPTGVSGAPAGWAFAPAADTPAVTRLRAVDTSWDAVAEAGPPWLAAITRRLARREDDGLPFAVLVVEVDDLDRLLASQADREVAFALEDAERGLTAELAPADLVVRERLGRWWLTSPDRDGAGARDLATRVAAAIARAQLGGAPLAASIGVAVCPDDADTLDALASRADQGMFAARAAGVPVA